MCKYELPTSRLSKVIYCFTAWELGKCECVQLVTRGHFRSRDKYGGHAIRSVIAENTLHTQILWLYFVQNQSNGGWKFYIAGIEIFNVFYSCDLETLIRWPSYTNLTRIPWSYTGCANKNFLSQGFRKLSSNRHTYRQTRPTKVIGLPRRFAGGQKCTVL